MRAPLLYTTLIDIFSCRFKGKKEGLISENSNYYIFKKQADGTFEASPVDSWYSFTSVAKHKTLTAEEAEEEFGRWV